MLKRMGANDRPHFLYDILDWFCPPIMPRAFTSSFPTISENNCALSRSVPITESMCIFTVLFAAVTPAVPFVLLLFVNGA